MFISQDTKGLVTGPSGVIGLLVPNRVELDTSYEQDSVTQRR